MMGKLGKRKRKRLQTAKAERMREMKQQRRSTETSEVTGEIDAGATDTQLIERRSDASRELADTGDMMEEVEDLSGLSDIEDESAPSSDDEELTDEKAQNCFDDWVVSLPALDRKMLAVSLSETFIKRQKMKATDAVVEAASFVGVNEKTVRSYRREFFSNKGKFKETKRGHYTRNSHLQNEDLKLDAAMWVRENAHKKGAANMTASSFCQWVNDMLLEQHDIPPDLPHRISVSTATRWLHQLGFRPQSHKKGAYVDGHEREDVVAARKKYLKLLRELKSIHLPPPPCSDERATTPPPDAETRKRLVLLYHDESIFSTNEGQTWMWATEDTPVIQPKTKGAGIMVSDFIDQHRGYLRLTEAEHTRALASDPDFPGTARATLEYGAEKEGYWTGEKFMTNVKDATRIAETIYPSTSHTLVWIFDQSSCHRAFSEDALNVRRMNVRPGGAQPPMRDTVWGGKVQRMVLEDGTPKGMRLVLEERGINTSTMNAEDMRVVLANHYDFQQEKTIVEHYLDGRGHKVIFLPKFHCELNPIERVWGQAKVYTRKNTNFTLQRLRQIINPALDSVTLDLIRKFFRRVEEYERAYLAGKKAGKELEQAVKVYKSHRRIFYE